MNRKIIMGILAVMITAFLIAPSIAEDPKEKPDKKVPKFEVGEKGPFEPGEKGPSKHAGKSNIGHLYLYEKAPDPSDEGAPWLIVEGGMWGKMKYILSGPEFEFDFNGHRLPIGQTYTLIYYPDPWPGEGLICLGSGIVTESEEGFAGDESGGGNIHIKGSVDTKGDLPSEDDENFLYGAKIFLVPSDHVSCEDQEMTNWALDSNLYEGALITFDYTGNDELIIR